MKKGILLFGMLLCLSAAFGCGGSGKQSEDSETAGESEERVMSLNTDLDFSTVSPYKYAEGNGALHAKCSPESIGKDSPKLTVTLENTSDKTEEWKNEEPCRLEKEIDGEWYYEKKEVLEVDAICMIFESNSTETRTYELIGPMESGMYRILYLFRGNWCSAQFEIL